MQFIFSGLERVHQELYLLFLVHLVARLFSYYIEIGYFIYSSGSCFSYRKRIFVLKKERKLKCVEQNFVRAVT